MSREAWAAELTLDVQEVRRLLEGRAPADAELDALERVGHGYEFDAWRAGAWVFRVPRHDGYERSEPWEGAYVELVAPRVRAVGVAVPAPRVTIPPAHGFPYSINGHRWIDGVDASDAPWDRVVAGLPLLGRAVRTVHSIPDDDWRRVGLPLSDWGMKERLGETHGQLERLRTFLDPVVDADILAVADWVAAIGPDDLPPEYAGTPLPLHGDLGAEHVLVDPATGRLQGIIDWTDASAGDPAHDFVGIRAVWGRDGMARALEGYGPTDPGLEERATFMARVSSLHWLHDAHLRGADVAKHRRWIRAAFDLPAP